jgi:hypothetical protein
MIEACQKAGVDLSTLPKPETTLPFVMIYGRSDDTAAWSGAKIPPSHFTDARDRVPGLTESTRNFLMPTHEDDKGFKHLTFLVELKPGLEPADPSLAGYAENLLNALAEINQDFRAAWHMDGNADRVKVEFVRAGTGEFANLDLRKKVPYTKEAPKPGTGLGL